MESTGHDHVLAEPTAEPLVEVLAPAGAGLTVRLASNQGERNQASYLLHRMYGWRGYTSATLPEDPNRVTLVATRRENAVGTITVCIDSAAGMSADALYPDEIGALRSTGARLCEFTRFAVDRNPRSLQLLAMMFHISHLIAQRRYGASHVVVEVNPRHVRFYTKLLGFEVIGPERHCPRVGAPAVLMILALDFVDAQIERFGGKPELAKSMRSLYPLAFSPHEERAIANRLFAGDKPLNH